MNALVRTQISLPRDQRREASQIASWQNVSLAEVIRCALREYVQKQRKKQAERETIIKRLAGAWKNSPNWRGVDAVAWQRKLRHEKGI